MPFEILQKKIARTLSTYASSEYTMGLTHRQRRTDKQKEAFSTSTTLLHRGAGKNLLPVKSTLRPEEANPEMESIGQRVLIMFSLNFR